MPSIEPVFEHIRNRLLQEYGSEYKVIYQKYNDDYVVYKKFYEKNIKDIFKKIPKYIICAVYSEYKIILLRIFL